MVSINPYLNFQGNTEEAMNFYRSVFGGEFLAMNKFNENPDSSKMPDKEQNMVMHSALPIGEHNLLMATDALESMGQKVSFGNNFYFCINTESKEEADRLFTDLSAKGKIEMPMSDTFWGAYFGICVDQFNIQWMINFDAKALNPG